jgi:hypothetical protein
MNNMALVKSWTLNRRDSVQNVQGMTNEEGLRRMILDESIREYNEVFMSHHQTRRMYRDVTVTMNGVEVHGLQNMTYSLSDAPIDTAVRGRGLSGSIIMDSFSYNVPPVVEPDIRVTASVQWAGSDVRELGSLGLRNMLSGEVTES